MEEMILRFIPGLTNYPIFLIIAEIVTFLFFGGIIFSSFWNIINKFRG